MVVRIVTTHFLNPLEGIASSLSRSIGDDDRHSSSAFRSVSVGSNQNKHVIFVSWLAGGVRINESRALLVLRIQPNFHHYH